ncbi:MAG: hypothetical protein KDK51_05095 [Deltaproteobacteria bacterium]|nr:hypothetical protein [Deltaproteobacteria bacterium]
MDFIIKKGLDLPISGAITDDTLHSTMSSEVAIIGPDYHGMKPTMQVQEGDKVITGQVLFTCKKNIGLVFTSPATGTIKAIHRGKKRVFQSIVIELADTQEHVSLQTYKGSDLSAYNADEIRKLLIESGEWTSIRQRPFDKVADINGDAACIFVTAVDTHPLAPNPSIAIKRQEQAFHKGLEVLTKLVAGPTYVCVGADSKVHTPQHAQIKRARFEGPHPAGNVGTHIHMISPAHLGHTVWHIGYQDVIAIGHLLTSGKLFS